MEVADAIRDHYKPQGQDDDAPTAPVSVAVALAERMDILTGFFALGELPTGSKDPFALRRAALGIIRTVLENNLRVEVSKIITDCLAALRNQIGEGFGPGKIADLPSFFHDRLKVYLKDKGHRFDAIEAVLTDVDGAAQDDFVLINMKLQALEDFLKTDDGVNLAAGFKRAANILKAEAKKGDLPSADAVDETKLQAGEEIALFKALEGAEKKAAAAVKAENFEDAMAALASLRAPIDAFFEAVTVNDDDATLRANRLALLARFRLATARVADLSKLEG